MLKFGNLEFRNLQEQVEENMKDIKALKSGQVVLDEFGIKVVGEVESVDDMPTVAEYKEEVPDWEYGDAFAIGTEPPYTMYILTRANGEHEEDYWFDIGEFPAPGPQGPQGPQGPEGQQGQTGDTGPAGADAGFGTPTATATMTTRGSTPIVDVTATGPNTEKVFNFDFYLPVATPKVTINSASGSLTLAEYNILHNYEDSVIVFRNGAGIDIVPYTLNRWYESSDYIVYVGLYSYSPYKTGIYRCRVDRSNRTYLLYADEAIKINKWNISTAINSNTNETAGKVLTADGNGGASWEDAAAGMEVVSLTTYPGTLSDANYAILNSDNGLIKYTEYGVSKYFKKQSDVGTYIYYFDVDVDNGTWWGGFKITKSSKYYNRENTYLNITSSNIKTGSLVAGQFLKSNGSGGSTWGDPPSQVQADWNQTSQSSPAYIKNKPTIPTVPVTDVTVNGTSVLDGTTAKVLVDTVDGTIGGTSGNDWTTLTINGSTASIPAAQVQANWTESDNTKASYIQNKPTIPSGTVTSVGLSAASGSNLSVSGSPITSSGSMTVGVASGYSIPSITDHVTWNGDMKYQGTVGTSADITWSNLISSSKTVKKGDTYYVKTARALLSPYASTGNLIIATKNGVGNDSNMWAVLGTRDTNGTVTSVSVGGTTASQLSGMVSIATGTAYDSTTNPVATLSDVPVKDVTINGNSVLSSGTAIIQTQGTYNVLSNKIATMSDLPASVSGTNDGTNWTSITVGNDTYAIPAGGGSSTDVQINGTSIVSSGTANILVTSETWSFTLSDDSVITKTVVTGVSG